MASIHGKTRVLVVLGLLLGLAVALGVLGYVTVTKQYRENAEVRLDPLGLAVHPVGEDPTLAPSTRRVVFFGDSRAQNWSTPARFGAGVQIVNRGIGRQTSAQAVERFDRHVSALRPRVVVLEVGVNDLTKLAELPERYDAIVRECEANIDEIVARARRAGAVVVVTTIFPIGEMPLYRRLFWSNRVDAAILEVNAHLRGLAGPGIEVFDAGRLLVDSRGVVRREMSLDFLHLNGNGYGVLNRALEPLVSRVLGPTETP